MTAGSRLKFIAARMLIRSFTVYVYVCDNQFGRQCVG